MAKVLVDKLQGGHYAFLGELPQRYGLSSVLKGNVLDMMKYEPTQPYNK